MAPVTGSFQTVLLSFLYLGTGYLSLLIAYRFSGDLESFYQSVSGTDKILQTFLIGSFSLILVTQVLGGPGQINLQNFPVAIVYLLGVIISNSFIIYLIREES